MKAIEVDSVAVSIQDGHLFITVEGLEVPDDVMVFGEGHPGVVIQQTYDGRMVFVELEEHDG